MRAFTPIGWLGSTATDTREILDSFLPRGDEAPTYGGSSLPTLLRHWLGASLFPVARVLLIFATSPDSEARQLLILHQ